MIAILVFPLLFAVAGLLMYALCTNAKLQEIGRIAFFCGLFWLVYLLTDKTFRLG